VVGILSDQIKEYLGVIPARGGSRAIPRKNLWPLCGRPLIEYTFDAALNSTRLTRIILSTDDEEIAEVGRQAGVEVPFMRPTQLASDEAPTLPVVQHLISELVAREEYMPDAVVVLQPTSPLRRADHIDEALSILESQDCDSVVSIVDVPHQFHPVSVMKIEDGYLVPFLPGEGVNVLRRQDKSEVVARNGAAIYATKSSVIMRDSLFGDSCCPLRMLPEDSVDIDSMSDMLIAEALIRNRAF